LLTCSFRIETHCTELQVGGSQILLTVALCSYYIRKSVTSIGFPNLSAMAYLQQKSTVRAKKNTHSLKHRLGIHETRFDTFWTFGPKTVVLSFVKQHSECCTLYIEAQLPSEDGHI
jgi:hypothetical protein